MSLLSPRLQLKVQQKQILTPGLVQMVTVLQLNRLELRDLISQEIAQNPVLDEAGEAGGEELSPEEVQQALEAESEPNGQPADQSILEATNGDGYLAQGAAAEPETDSGGEASAAPAADGEAPDATEPKATADPFEEIDFGSFFDDYLDPGYKSPSSEQVDKPSFETFLSAPVTLGDYLRSQLSMVPLPDRVRDAADSIIGNLDESGYLTASLEEIAESGEHAPEDVELALREVQKLDPAGVGARDVRECLLVQLESRNGRGGVATSDVREVRGEARVLEVARMLGDQDSGTARRHAEELLRTAESSGASRSETPSPRGPARPRR